MSDQDWHPIATAPTACSHVWIDPREAPITRARYSSAIGALRREMKPNTLYRCQCCDATVRPQLTHERSR
jgi:hypothetical protein